MVMADNRIFRLLTRLWQITVISGYLSYLQVTYPTVFPLIKAGSLLKVGEKGGLKTPLSPAVVEKIVAPGLLGKYDIG